MRDKAKNTLDKAKTAFSRINKKVRILLAVIALVALIVVLWLVMQGGGGDDPYVTLFTDLSAEDMSAVQSFLDTNGVTHYRIEGGNTIRVLASEEPDLRARLVEEKYPTSGFGYGTYLENVGTLSSNSDREILSLFDLQDRLAATIRCIKGVKEATVFLSRSEDQSYILDTNDVTEARASIMVEMNGGGDLDEELASSIRQLVSSSMRDLQFENITINDTNGNSFSGQEEDGTSVEDASDLKLALETRVNETLRDNVLQVLVPMFGGDNVAVSVSSTVDVSRTYNDETTYEEPEWAADGSSGGEGIIGTKVYDNRIALNEDQVAGGTVGTATNADLNEYVERYQPDGTERELVSSGEVNYNVDTFHAQRENAGGVVTDVMVAVSVNSEAGQWADVLSLRGLVARAARISPEQEADKVQILMGPFFRAEDPDAAAAEQQPGEDNSLPMWLYLALFLGIIFFILLLILLLYLRKRAKIISARRAAELAERQRLQAEAQAALLAEQGNEAVAPAGADIMDLNSERSMELRMNVRQFAEENPEICAQMIKNWLKGGEEGG